MLNLMQIMQMMRSGTPQQMIFNNLKSQAGNNPVLGNALDMAQKGDSKGLEELARNLCKTNGVDADEAMKQLKSQFGIK